MKKLLVVLAVLLMFGMMASVAAAQDSEVAPASDSSQPAQNQPGVARVSFIHGSVSMQRGDNTDWTALTLNTPIMPGDRVSTGPDGAKGELQLDWADILRLSNDATATVVTLDQNNIHVQVGQGLVTYAVLNGAQAASEIDTPNAAFHPNGQGEYRIMVNPDGETVAIVRSGSMEVSTPQGSTQVDQGQMITVQGTDNPQYRVDPAPGTDDWDSWNNDRDNVIARAQDSRHLDRYYVGSQDLDAYGHWTDVPDYGQVWVPSVDSDWAPYRAGRWVYEPYYGWTWVSYEPWGWAPYHYGRWFVYGGNWVWWPGPVYGYPDYYPVWAPAYVSFFGWGGAGWGVGFGFGFGWGHVGWLPCGPGDWYHPWWGRWGGRYHDVDFDRINAFHEGFRPLGREGWHHYSNFDGAFRDGRIRGGISTMEGHNFGREAVSMHQDRISEATLRGSRMSTGRMPVQPGRESYSATNRRADPASFRHAPPSSQHFFSGARQSGTFARGAQGFNSRPAGTARAAQSFGAMRGNGATTSSRPGWRTFTPPNTSNSRGNSSRSFSSPNNGNHGSFNSPDRGNRGNGAITSPRPGWRTFTPPNTSNSRGFNNSSRSFSSPNNGNRGSFNSPDRGNRGSFSAPNGGNRGSFSAPRGSNQPASNRGGWQHFTQPSPGSRGSYNNSRPSLNMRQPIVTPRNSGSAGRGSYSPPRSYSRPQTYSQPRSYSQPRVESAPRSYNAPRSYSPPRSYSRPQTYSQPRSYSQPRFESAPRSYSAPRSSGGSFRGGGGGGGSFHGGGGGGSHGGGSRGGGGHGHGH